MWGLTNFKKEWVVGILFTWITLLMHLYIPNMGGVGLALPQNTLSWGMMALLSLVIWLGILFNEQRIVITPTMKLLFLALALLAVPLLYTRPEWLEAALWRWAGLLGGLIFYFSWLQVSAFFRLRRVVYYGLLFAISVQVLLALLQLFTPELSWVAFRASRIYGVFQQANVLASFIATGVALALMLSLLPGFALRQARYEHCRQAFLSVLLLVLPALLVWIQSRVGWLGSRGEPLFLTPGQSSLTYTVTPERTKAPLVAGVYRAAVDFQLSYD